MGAAAGARDREAREREREGEGDGVEERQAIVLRKMIVHHSPDRRMNQQESRDRERRSRYPLAPVDQHARSQAVDHR